MEKLYKKEIRERHKDAVEKENGEQDRKLIGKRVKEKKMEIDCGR